MRIKRAVALILAIIMMFCIGCTPKNEDMFAELNETAKKYAEISVKLNKAVLDEYWLDEVQFAYHYYPNKLEADHSKADTAFVWPYTEMVASSWRVATLSKAAKNYIEPLYRSTLSGFEYYLSQNKTYHCYVATRAIDVGMAGGDTYYDDNVWISREFLNAFEVLGDAAYLNTSEAVAEYVYSGWANDELGGIFWCEQKRTSRNTCSNAPAVILFARLYQQTKKQIWLDRAKQVYDWTYKTLRDPSDNVYWDNISNEGNITDWKFTYNTGSMIGAGAKLYEITNEEKYLNHSKASALGAYNHWFTTREGFDYKVITSDNPWFNVLLLDAWVELYHFAPEVLPYIETYEKNLNNAYSIRDEASGFMPSNWVTGFGKEQDGSNKVYALNILDMAANAENMGTLAYFYQYVKEV